MANQDPYREFLTQLRDHLGREATGTDDPFWRDLGVQPLPLDEETFYGLPMPLTSKQLLEIARRHTKWELIENPYVAQAGQHEELRYVVRRRSDGCKLQLMYEPADDGKWRPKAHVVLPN